MKSLKSNMLAAMSLITLSLPAFAQTTPEIARGNCTAN